MDIKSFLDSTYLKTAAQAGISENENTKLVVNCIQEAIDENFKLVMIRPEMVSLAKKMVTSQKSKVTIGTVIDFPKGNSNYSGWQRFDRDRADRHWQNRRVCAAYPDLARPTWRFSLPDSGTDPRAGCASRDRVS